MTRSTPDLLLRVMRARLSLVGQPLLERPQWHARSEQMSAWVNQELDRIPPEYLEDFRSLTDEDVARAYDLLNTWKEETLHDETEAAEKNGDIEPLRRKLPHLAKFLQLPKQLPGVRRTRLEKLRRDTAVMGAINDAKRIRALWKLHYNKKNRRVGDVTAEEIAAARWGIDVEDVIAKLKKL